MSANGKIPAAKLKKLGTPGVLLAAAQASFDRLNKEAKVTPGTTNAAQAYRSLDQQRATFLANYDRTYRKGMTVANGGKRVYQGHTYYRKPGKPTTATPGTSNHGVGNTVDWQGLKGYGTKEFKEFEKLAKKHGWNNTEGKKINEYWHWTYVEKNDTVLAAAKKKAAEKAAARAKMKQIQGLLGVPKTGLPDAKTLAAWNKCPNGKPKTSTMAKCQQVLAVKDDGKKGTITKAAFTKLSKAAK